MEIKYTRQGDYLIPNLYLEKDEECERIGKYGILRLHFIAQNKQIGIIDNSMNKEIRYKKKVHNLSVLALNQNIETYINNYKEVFNCLLYTSPSPRDS